MRVRVVALTLSPSEVQRAQLLRLRSAWQQACNYLSGVAWRTQTFHHFALQKIAYHECRARCGLLAEHTLRALHRVAYSYKQDRTKQHRFARRSAISLAPDSEGPRTRLYKLRATFVEISALEGRIHIPLNIGGNQRARLNTARKIGEALLVEDRKDRWRLLVSCYYDDPPESEPTGYLGVDMGIKTIAATSDGVLHSGALRNGLRHRHIRLRAKLQAKGTRSAKRLLRKRARKQRLFQRNENHVISKSIVTSAQGTGRGIAVEQLTGILQRVSARGAQQRSALGNWAFAQLGQFLRYKAQMAGVRVVQVDPRNTSRTCLTCGCIDAANRPSQAVFRCVECGESGQADHHAARVIASRAAAMQPHAMEGCHGIAPPIANSGLTL